MKKWWIILSVLIIAVSANAQAGFSFKEQPDKKEVDVLYNGKLLTAYCYYDSSRKPVLFPVNTLDGITVTRGYPFASRTGERTDHPHHTGIWMNYESVNGLDFWNNSTAIAPDKRDKYGTIVHDRVIGQTANNNRASLTVSARWIRPDGVQLLKEITTFIFTVANGVFNIERTSTLQALDIPVVLKDVKDGFFAIRVARELEMPSKEPGIFVDAYGNETKVPVDNNGVTGMYINSDGVQGDSVWSTKSRWAMLQGTKESKPITIGLFDHPKNIGFPTYWHARGYGLFAANPLGRKVFSNGKEELNFTLKPRTSTTFRYKVLIASGKKLDKAFMDREADAFGKGK
jgi:hypothetical protein